jgi:hypothetical protein
MATTHFSGPVAIGAGSVKTVTAAYTVPANENGMTYILDAAAGAAVTLPSPSAGLRYKFITGPTAFATTDWVLTSASANMYGVLEEAGAVQAVSGATTINFELAAEAPGDYIDVISDGTNWYVSGQFATALSVTPA